jgi:hypothetical protein
VLESVSTKNSSNSPVLMSASNYKVRWISFLFSTCDIGTQVCLYQLFNKRLASETSSDAVNPQGMSSKGASLK